MKEKITNPFITSGYVSPDYFCNRITETKKILNAINSRRNLTLISLRRTGKTGLLKHVKYLLEHSAKEYTVIYIDLLPTMSGNELLNSICTELVRIKKAEKNFFEKMLTLLASLRPRLTIDSLTGEPSVELKVESPASIQSGLSQLLGLLADIRHNIVFMFDEFQQISKYPEKNIEQLLRSVIQTFPMIPFIFSGSSKHMLENMFLSAARPFYQSSELMYLDKISRDEYSEFISDNFRKNKKIIDQKSIDKIFEWTRLHTYYVQYVFNMLFENNSDKVDNVIVNNIFFDILTSFEPQYLSFRNLIPTQQFMLLKAIAAENGISQPTSGRFIMEHGLKSASSVATSLKALSEKEMIIHDNNQWLVYDVFFSRWLEYRYKTL
jgi:uncharacterized protein